MSFAYLALFTGDYLRDTRGLSPMKHGVYLLLLMNCWDTREPLPLDEQDCAGIANCRSTDEVEALRYILEKYFVRMDDGYYNPRMQREIERAEVLSAKRKHAGFKGYQARAKQLPSKCPASASTPSPSLTPSLTPTPSLRSGKVSGRETRSTTTPLRGSDSTFTPPEWIPAEQWSAWLEMRLKRRNPAPVFAQKLAVAKLQNLRELGHAPGAVLAQSAFRGWAGLFPVKEDA